MERILLPRIKGESLTSVSSDEIPSSAPSPEPDASPWLDEDFLIELLTNYEKTKDITIIRWGKRHAKATDYSNIDKVVVAYQRKGVQVDRTLIIKSIPTTDHAHHFIIKTEDYERELEMHLRTLPALMEIADSTLPAGIISAISADIFPTKRSKTLVMEDLTYLGFRRPDRRLGLNEAQCILALKRLAQLHALSIQLAFMNQDAMLPYVEKVYTEDRRKEIEEFFLPSFETLATEVERWPGYFRFGDKLRKFSKSVADILIQGVKPVPGVTSVLNHGDFWVNNMLFLYSGKGAPVDIRLLDFQATRYTTPVADLQYFFYTSPNKDVRFERRDGLLAVYHRELEQIMTHLEKKDILFPLPKLMSEMRRLESFGFIFACSILGAILTDAKTMQELKEMIRKVSFWETIKIEKKLSIAGERPIVEESSSSDTDDVFSENGDEIPHVPLGNRFRKAFQDILDYVEKQGVL